MKKILFYLFKVATWVNYHKISAKAVKLGIITEEQSSFISENDLNKIMFAPGFSTTDKITDVSGRGVGLDVVKSIIESIGGTISVISVFGEGSSFILSVPLTLTTFDSILVNISGNKYALPKQFIQSTINITLDKIITNGANKEILIDNKPVRLLEFSTILDENKSEFSNEITVVVLESSDLMVAFIVDDFIESRKMVMKTLGTQLLKVPNISGATIMGDGEPVLVLNPTEILSAIASESFKIPSLDINVMDTNREAKRTKTRILVVDDSITTRTLEKNILESAGYEVVIGKNGLEGKEGVEKYKPDLIITDVEMPKMNGYQFASWVKKESTYSNTPVIMISSLATPELKQKGYDSGVNAYIVKGEFNQNKLLETINKLLN